MADQAPRSRRSGTQERTPNRAGRPGPRRCRIILYVVGGLLGPGFWLCGSVSDVRPFGKSPAEVHFTEFVLASVVVVVASWGLLLILGEALLFALAVFKADDREQYDIYRNLMILWGYVLTLGIPRHFRKLPAQFEDLADDVRRTGPRARGQGGPAAYRDGGRSRQRTDARDRAGYREPEDGRDRTRARARDRDDTRDRVVYRDRENPRDHVGCRDKTQDWPEHWDHEDVRDGAGCRHRERGQGRTGSRETKDRDRSAERADPQDRSVPREREGARDRTEDAVRREHVPDQAKAEPAAPEHLGPLGPIFPPRPAAEVEVAPMAPAPAVIVPPAALTAQAFAAIKGVVPDAELRNALDLLLRYAACLPADEAPPRKATERKTFGIAAEAGGEV